MKYLDPRADLTFKKIFGEHKDIVISFLNALLPLADDQQIETIEYIPSELVPEHAFKKNSIVDVRCTDEKKRQFIVEMQMNWTSDYRERTMYNMAKAYTSQFAPGDDYISGAPVYSLNLIDDIFESDIEEYYHHYRFTHANYPEKIIKGQEIIFVELPKFKPNNANEKRMRELWLRFLTEMKNVEYDLPEYIHGNPELEQAAKLLEVRSMSKAEMASYDKFWDIISTERTFYNSATRKGFAAGMEAGMEAGKEAGHAEGIQDAKREIAEKLRAQGMSDDIIKSIVG